MSDAFSFIATVEALDELRAIARCARRRAAELEARDTTDAHEWLLNRGIELRLYVDGFDRRGAEPLPMQNLKFALYAGSVRSLMLEGTESRWSLGAPIYVTHIGLGAKLVEPRPPATVNVTVSSMTSTKGGE